MADTENKTEMSRDDLLERLSALEADSKSSKRNKRIDDFIGQHGKKFKGNRGIAESFLNDIDARGVEPVDSVVEDLLNRLREEVAEISDAIAEVKEEIAGGGSDKGADDMNNMPPLDLPPDLPPLPDAGGAPPMGDMPPPPPGGDMGGAPPPPPPGGMPPGNALSDETMKDKKSGPDSETGKPSEGQQAVMDIVQGADVGGVAGSLAGGALGGAIGGPAGAAVGKVVGGEAGKKIGRELSDKNVKEFATHVGFPEMEIEDLRKYLGELEERTKTGGHLSVGDKLLLNKWHEVGSPDNNFSHGTIDVTEFDPKNYSPEEVAELDQLADAIAAGENLDGMDTSDFDWLKQWGDFKSKRDAAKMSEGDYSEKPEAGPAKPGLMDDIDENEIIAKALARKF